VTVRVRVRVRVGGRVRDRVATTPSWIPPHPPLTLPLPLPLTLTPEQACRPSSLRLLSPLASRPSFVSPRSDPVLGYRNEPKSCKRLSYYLGSMPKPEPAPNRTPKPEPSPKLDRTHIQHIKLRSTEYCCAICIELLQRPVVLSCDLRISPLCLVISHIPVVLSCDLPYISPISPRSLPDLSLYLRPVLRSCGCQGPYPYPQTLP
jgi:hypothetical protein